VADVSAAADVLAVAVAVPDAEAALVVVAVVPDVAVAAADVVEDVNLIVRHEFLY
jgi:hypothetical protein